MKRIFWGFTFLLMTALAHGQAIKFEFSNIEFKTNSAEIDFRTYPALDSLGEFLKNSGAKIEIAGHTDNVGNPKNNFLLSQRRAESVKRYLVSRKGIPSAQITAKGYGDLFPLVPNLTAEYRARNRRVEITVLSKIRTARLSFMQGNVFTRKQGISKWQPAVLDQVLTIQDEVVTDSQSRAEITFDNGGKVKLLPGSDIVITRQSWNDLDKSGETEIKLLVGRTLSKVTKLGSIKEHFSVATPTAVAGIRGTEFIVEQRKDMTALLSVWENDVSWRGQEEGSLEKTVPSGKGSRCLLGQQPGPVIDLAAPPFPKGPTANDTFFYNPDRPRPIVFKWSKPKENKAHIMVWLDVDQNEIISDAFIATDSFAIMPPKNEKIFWQLSSIDSIGLEGQPWPSRVLNLYRKLDNPSLNIINPKPDQKISSNLTLVTGQTEPRSTITVNGRLVNISPAGQFSDILKLSPGINNITITSTDRAGNSTAASFSVVSSPYNRYEIYPFVGGVKLLGGDLDNSKVGILAGLKAGFNFNEKFALGLVGEYSKVGTNDIDPGYSTKLEIAGAWAKYTFAPASIVSPVFVLEAGAVMWENQHNGGILYQSNNPYVSAGPGVRMSLYPKVNLMMEGKAGYMTSKEPTSGPTDANNLILTGAMGISFGF